MTFLSHPVTHNSNNIHIQVYLLVFTSQPDNSMLGGLTNQIIRHVETNHRNPHYKNRPRKQHIENNLRIRHFHAWRGASKRNPMTNNVEHN